MSHFGLDLEVRFDDGDTRRVRLERGTRGVVVGDRVRVERGRVRALPRSSVLERRDARGRTRAIAANLDVVGVAVSSHPPAPESYVDRVVVAARAAGIEPFVVVNKCDLEPAAALARSVRATYAAPEGSGLEAPIRVFAVSAVDARGLAELRAFFAAGPVPGARGRRGVFVGTSGVGKSSLVNALVPGAALDTGEINRMTRLGRHVTTRSTLHALPDGGDLIDTPGFRDFVPVALQPSELAAHFPGFEPGLARGCRFRDCLHRNEPGCGVAAAVADGEIAASRRATYFRILDDLERVARDERVRGARS